MSSCTPGPASPPATLAIPGRPHCLGNLGLYVSCFSHCCEITWQNQLKGRRAYLAHGFRVSLHHGGMEHLPPWQPGSRERECSPLPPLCCLTPAHEMVPRTFSMGLCHSVNLWKSFTNMPTACLCPLVTLNLARLTVKII